MFHGGFVLCCIYAKARLILYIFGVFLLVLCRNLVHKCFMVGVRKHFRNHLGNIEGNSLAAWKTAFF